MYRSVQLCAHGGGYEARPEPPRAVDLPRIRRALETSGVSVVDARVMLICALEPETTISRSGRLLFKTRDAEEAQRTLDRLRPLLEPARADGPARG